MPRSRRVLGYARVSSQEQALGSSLQDQQDAITSYAKARGLAVTRFYVEAESAIQEKIERREQMRLLLRDVRKDDLVLCDKVDRWSRDPAFTYTSVKAIIDAGAAFYAVTDRLDPSTSEGDTALGFRILFAREEHKKIKERMVGTRRLLRDKGYYVEGQIPFGYARPTTPGLKRLERNVLVVEPEAADLVRRMFAMCIRGGSINVISEKLGVHRDRVADSLRSRFYTGEIQDSRGEWIRGKHPSIIDAATFTKARAAVASRSLAGRVPRQDSETKTWILRSIARCARCGAKMAGAYAGEHGAKRRHYYRCFAKCTPHYITVATVEAEAEPLILARLVELRATIAKGANPVAADRIDFAAKRTKLQRRRDKYLEAFADEMLSRDDLRVKMAKLDDEQHRLDIEEASLAKPSPLADKQVRREMLATLGAMSSAWEKTKADGRRTIVTQLASAVRIAAGAAPRFVWRSAEDLAADLYT